MKSSIALLAALMVLGGCQSQTRRAEEVVTRGSGYLDRGPTENLDRERVAGANTTLERVGELESENSALRSQLTELQGDLRSSKGVIANFEQRLRDLESRGDQLHRELQSQAGKNKELQDEYLRARIAKARVEQELLELQLANLIREDR